MVPALEQTSSEIYESLLNHAECPKPSVDKLNRLLVMADMVKFAKALPVATENDMCLTDGVEFVRSMTGVTTGKTEENQ